MKYLVQVSYTNPSHEHVSLRRRVDTVNRLVEATDEQQAILRVSRQQQALGFLVREAKIVVSSTTINEDVEEVKEEVESIEEASKEGKDVMRSVRSSLKSMDLRHGVDSDKRVSGYKMSPAVKAAQAKSDALSKPVKRPQAGTLAAVHKSMEREMERSMKKEEVEEIDEAGETSFKLSQLAKQKATDLERYPSKDGSLGKLRKNPDKQKIRALRDLANKAYARSRNPTGAPTGNVEGGGHKSLRRQGATDKDIPPSPMNMSKLMGYFKEEAQYIEEKLTAADPASKWISDFVASDNPKFAGKSKKERIRMALGAHYAAKREKNEAVEKYNEKEVKSDEKKQEKKKGSMNKLNMEPEMEANIQGVK